MPRRNRLSDAIANTPTNGAAREVGRVPARVAVAQLGLLPVVAGDDAPATIGPARAFEHVVVVGVGHRVVEAELLARLDVAHRDEQHRADDAAVRIARVVDVVGRIERRRAREEQVVVDLQGVDAHGLAEILELLAVDDVAAEPGDGRVRRDRVDANTPIPFVAVGRVPALG